jgi:ATP-dependent Zn protease
VQALLDPQYARSIAIVEKHRDKVEALAQELRHEQASVPGMEIRQLFSTVWKVS